MKRQIRKGVFETNSSSLHSICISKEPVKSFPSQVFISENDYGWEEDTVRDTASYLYSAIKSCPDDVFMDYMDKLRDVLKRHGVQLVDNNGRCGCIDHCYELQPFLRDLFDDEDKLLRFLFSPASCVYTGNDNSGEETGMCCCAEPVICVEDEETGKWKDIPNPNYDPEHFEYFMKGN